MNNYLSDAVENNDSKLVKKLLYSGYDPNRIDFRNKIPNDYIMSLLIFSGFNPFVKNVPVQITRMYAYSYDYNTQFVKRMLFLDNQVKTKIEKSEQITITQIKDLDQYPDKYQIAKNIRMEKYIYYPIITRGSYVQNYVIDESIPDNMFVKACTDGDLDKVKKFLSRGFDVNYKLTNIRNLDNEYTGIVLAMVYQQYDIIDYLLDNTNAKITFSTPIIDEGYPFAGVEFVKRMIYLFHERPETFKKISKKIDLPLSLYQQELFDMEMFSHLAENYELSPDNYLFLIEQVKDEYYPFIEILYKNGIQFPNNNIFFNGEKVVYGSGCPKFIHQIQQKNQIKKNKFVNRK